MIPPRPTIALAALCLLGACSDKPDKPVSPADQAPADALPPDSFAEIGKDAAGLVESWTVALKSVQTEQDASVASRRLGAISEQFDALLERSTEVPALGVSESKRVDTETDFLISRAATGFEQERKRIFLLPDEIKSLILPAHDRLVKKFRSVSRSISQTSRK